MRSGMAPPQRARCFQGHLAHGEPGGRPEPQKPAPVAPAESPDEAGDLLDDFLIALLDLPGDAWPDLAAALPDDLYDRIDRYLKACLP
jgi:hypothetical protein